MNQDFEKIKGGRSQYTPI